MEEQKSLLTESETDTKQFSDSTENAISINSQCTENLSDQSSDRWISETQLRLIRKVFLKAQEMKILAPWMTPSILEQTDERIFEDAIRIAAKIHIMLSEKEAYLKLRTRFRNRATTEATLKTKDVFYLRTKWPIHSIKFMAKKLGVSTYCVWGCMTGATYEQHVHTKPYNSYTRKKTKIENSLKYKLLK